MMKKQSLPSTHEEFSVEFGDVNWAKFFEFPHASKKNHKKSYSGHKK